MNLYLIDKHADVSEVLRIVQFTPVDGAVALTIDALAMASAITDNVKLDLNGTVEQYQELAEQKDATIVVVGTFEEAIHCHTSLPTLLS
jgi:hypothetical protein